MSAQSFEETLARLYTDSSFRNSFLANPIDTLKAFELTESERLDLMEIDKAGLLMASRSFYNKRQKRITNRSVLNRVKFLLYRLLRGP